MKIKQIASFFFGLAFLSAIFVFTNLGNYVPKKIALPVFIASGGLGLLLNIISFRQEKSKGNYNILFWIGSTILFIGLCARITNLPYSLYIICFGTLISGVSFFYNPTDATDNEQDDELIDQF